MSLFKFTPSDIKKGKILASDWYDFKVTKYEEAQSKKGATLMIWTLEGQSGEAAGVPVTYMGFPDNSPEQMIPFFKAFGVNFDDENAGAEVDPQAVVGKFVQGFVAPGEYNGKTVNNFTAFRPIDGGDNEVPF